jgi:hypothetical protein
MSAADGAGLGAQRAELHAAVAELIARLADGGHDPAARDALLRRVLRFQRDHVPAYARLVARLSAGEADPLRWPALPTDVFRFARVASHAPHEDVRVFRTSGTTAAARGQHALRDLSLYDRAAQAAARHALFPDAPRIKLVVLAAPASEAPDSSLGYMLERFGEWFGRGESAYVLRGGQLDGDRLARELRAAEREGEPLALLGTSFAFVHAEDALGAQRFALPAGSRIMQTGGFKGRTREVAEGEMLGLLARRYGVREPFIVQEYGMTELSSQLYESTLRDAALGRAVGPRRLLAPGWIRVSLVDPESLVTVAPGEAGLVRVDDLANVDSACAIQTADRARVVADGIAVLGRTAGATPRGCSLAVDAVLGGG